MNNLLIAEQLHRLSKLMELHQENIFKIKAIQNAASIIEKLHQEINETNYTKLADIKGIGKNILEKIREILNIGKIKELEHYEHITPESVVELLNIKGLGPSKVYKLWKELHICSIEALIESCEKNKLSTLKGFGEKTQQYILENARFYLENKHKFPLGLALSVATEVQKILKDQSIQAEVTGELRRQCEIVSTIEFITTDTLPLSLKKECQKLSTTPILIHSVKKEDYVYHLFKTTGSAAYLNHIHFNQLKERHFNSEEDIFTSLHQKSLPPFQREDPKEFFEVTKKYENPANILQWKDIKGILHCHTIYSDGLNTVQELADYVRAQGFHYLCICDHSPSARYANGLSPERLFQQIEEIEAYNRKHPEFRILKGIESDILKDGALDYDEEVLKQLDMVVASIHSHFEMTENEATKRLIKAIENPFTTILGHLTGRLLTVRKGYSINHKKIIDACAANQVVIELNANTYRLDIDWRWLPYCMEKGVHIAINPDAHEKSAIQDTYYGVLVAQKAGLTKDRCINTWDVNTLLQLKKY